MDFDAIKGAIDSVGGIEGIASGAKQIGSIFGKKKKNESSESASTAPSATQGNEPRFSDGLERLIAMVTEDGEITDDEMQMLCNRAEKEGIDPLEIKVVVKRRLKKQAAEAERLKNPVERIAEAFRMAEACASGGKEAASGSALSGALSLIPGVGGVAAVGSLAASLIKTPSNLNALKAEILANVTNPDEERYIADFLLFCQAQRSLESGKDSGRRHSISGMLSSLTMGDAVNLEPVWALKINQLITHARLLHPDSEMLRRVINQVYESPATRLRNLRKQNLTAFYSELECLTPPDNNEELVELVELCYALRDDDKARDAHKRLYKAAEPRVKADATLFARLKACKIKQFGIF